MSGEPSRYRAASEIRVIIHSCVRHSSTHSLAQASSHHFLGRPLPGTRHVPGRVARHWTGSTHKAQSPFDSKCNQTSPLPLSRGTERIIQGVADASLQLCVHKKFIHVLLLLTLEPGEPSQCRDGPSLGQKGSGPPLPRPSPGQLLSQAVCGPAPPDSTSL